MTLFLALELGVGELDGAALNRQMQRFFGDRTDEVIGRYTAEPARARDPATCSPRSPPTGCSASRRSGWPRPRPAGPARRTCTCSRGPTPGDGRQAQELPRAGAAVHVGRARPARASRCSPATGRNARRIADAMHAAWISFARTGDPGWPAVRPRPPGDPALRHHHRGARRPHGRRARPLGRHQLAPGPWGATG